MSQVSETFAQEYSKPVKSDKNKFIILYTIGIVLLVISLIAAIRAYSIPLEEEDVLFNNDIQLKTEHVLQYEVIPNLLHPKGGFLPKDTNKTARKILKGLKVGLNTELTGTQASTAQGTYSVYFDLVAEDMWHKEYPLVENKSFKTEGLKATILRDEIYVPLGEYYDFMEQVEEDTGLYPNSYTGKMRVVVNGDIASNGRATQFSATPELNFDMSNRNIEALGMINEMSSLSINDSKVIKNTFDIFGLELSLQLVRFISTLLSVMLILFIAISAAIGIRRRYLNTISEAERIERKFGNRLLEIDASPNFQNNNIIILRYFDALIKMADENDQPIMVYRDPVENNYFVPGANCVYMYVLNL